MIIIHLLVNYGSYTLHTFFLYTSRKLFNKLYALLKIISNTVVKGKMVWCRLNEMSTWRLHENLHK